MTFTLTSQLLLTPSHTQRIIPWRRVVLRIEAQRKLLPLNGGRRLGGDIIHDTVDAGDLRYGTTGHTCNFGTGASTRRKKVAPADHMNEKTRDCKEAIAVVQGVTSVPHHASITGVEALNGRACDHVLEHDMS